MCHITWAGSVLFSFASASVRAKKGVDTDAYLVVRH
jgi:hypothetical protein